MAQAKPDYSTDLATSDLALIQQKATTIAAAVPDLHRLIMKAKQKM